MIRCRPEIRPDVVTYAVAILSAALLVRAVDLIMVGLTSTMSATIFGLVILALIALLVWKIYQGRNWARITYLIYYVWSQQFIDWPFLLDIHNRYDELTPIQALSVVLSVLQIWALYAIFTFPGGDWFLKPEKPAEAADQGSSTASQ